MTNEATPTPDDGNTQKAIEYERIVTLVAAAALLAGFLWLSREMIEFAKVAGTDEKVWARMFSVYSGLSAIASAAAGVLLGTQVQRAAVITARTEANSANRETDRVKQGVADYMGSLLPSGGDGSADPREAYARLLQLVR